MFWGDCTQVKVCVRSQKDGRACCVQCLELCCCCFKFFVPRESAARLKWSVTGSSWCNGGDAVSANWGLSGVSGKNA